MEDKKMNFNELINDISDELIDIRQKLHRIPEKGFAEYKTAKMIEEILNELDIDVKTGIGGTGVIGIQRGKTDGPTIALRACLDALEMEDKSGIPYSSHHKGCMHACGHDGNMTMVLGAAKVLSKYKDHLNGNIKYIFQPSEENTGGADKLIKAGALKNPPVSAIVTPHNWHGIKQGNLVVKSGAVLASSDLFKIKIIGKPGHGAWPHLAVDPIIVATEVIVCLQKLISREIDPMKSAIVSIGKISGGTAANIIPDSVTLEGTVRTLDNDIRDYIQTRIYEIIKGLTSAARASFELDYKKIMPPVINDQELSNGTQKILKKAFDESIIVDDFEPSMGCEEFSLFQKEVPGLFIFIGNDKPNETIPIHSPYYVFNDEILKNGVKALCEIALWHTKTEK